MSDQNLQTLTINTLEELKAENITVLDVSSMTTITDTMIIASGRSVRHVKSLAQQLSEKIKSDSLEVLGIEGEQTAEWILVDLGDLVVHLMLPHVRDFYALEKLWSIGPSESSVIH